MHLVNQSLGTFDSHYESLIQHYCLNLIPKEQRKKIKYVRELFSDKLFAIQGIEAKRNINCKSNKRSGVKEVIIYGRQQWHFPTSWQYRTNISNESLPTITERFWKKKNRQMNVQFRGPISDTERGPENDIKTGRDTGDRPRYEHFWINAEKSL